MENKSYDATNLQDLLANVQKAQYMVSNLHNPYEKNDIELYEES
jgi:iron uptake system EfeUOB component EfeO/EfeM